VIVGTSQFLLIERFSNVAQNTLVLADVVVVNVVGVIDMIDDHVRFGTYHQLDFDHNLERHPFDGVIPPSSSTHLYRKALQSIVVSCHHRKNSRNSTN